MKRKSKSWSGPEDLIARLEGKRYGIAIIHHSQTTMPKINIFINKNVATCFAAMKRVTCPKRKSCLIVLFVSSLSHPIIYWSADIKNTSGSSISKTECSVNNNNNNNNNNNIYCFVLWKYQPRERNYHLRITLTP